VSRAQQHLRRAVPQRHDLQHRTVHRFRQSESHHHSHNRHAALVNQLPLQPSTQAAGFAQYLQSGVGCPLQRKAKSCIVQGTRCCKRAHVSCML
jgi:hypothetical protein